MSEPVAVPFTSFAESVARALDDLGAREVLARQSRVLLKPNLVTDSPHPVTTHPDMVRAVAEYARSRGVTDIIIGEGTGSATRETSEIFRALGYDRLARDLGVELLDLNHADLVTRSDPRCTVFPEMHLPRVAFEYFVVSLPVLKKHSLAGYTGTLKNMMGFAPPEHYGGRNGSWKKAVFHGRMQESLRDLARYIAPPLTVLDASVGLDSYHLGGATCDPPVGKILAGFDPHALDQAGARLLGLDPKGIAHLWP